MSHGTHILAVNLILGSFALHTSDTATQMPCQRGKLLYTT